MTITKKHISNILFFGFIIFIFTPYGMGTRAKLTQGVTYVKTFVFPPSAANEAERETLDTYNVNLKGIAYASDVNLESLKGKVVFINYWATWCSPCRAEMPSLKNLYADYKDKVVFLFLTSDNKSKVEKFYSSNKYKFPTYNPLSNLPKQISSTSIPATFVLDKQGRVVVSEVGAADWNSNSVRKTIDELLAE